MTKIARALILANGDPPSAALLTRLAAQHDLLIATDGAANTAAALGVQPDIISGDFDSLSREDAAARFPTAEIVPTPDQNQGDLEKAVRLARARGAAAITITGAGGGRMDHSLGTIAVLLRYHAELEIRLVDDHSETRALSGTDDAPGEWKFAMAAGDILSLLSFDGRARVTLQGVQWPLDDFLLPVGTRGLSNRATGEQVVIQVSGGVILACHLPQTRP